MPYIGNEQRETCSPWTSYGLNNPGQLNFAITKLVDEYLNNNYSKVSYAGVNEVIGVLECAKLELYRRIAAPYEDKKCSENGDVYSPALLPK